MAILKIEAFAGSSGDMFLGALCSLADAYHSITELPKLLHLESEAEIRITDVIKSGIACKHIKVIEKDPHHHHHSQSLHEHHPASDHPHPDTSHQPHHGRHLHDIYHLIDHAELSDSAKKIAKEIFLILGKAESKVHGKDLEEIHFHEVGAIDSMIDIIGTAWLLDLLKIEKTYSTPISTGFGFIRTEHGKLPVPAPATQMLLHGFPTKPGDQSGELTTPTGAAILQYLQPSFELPVLTEYRTGYGPGEKDLDIPNTLRLSLCHEQSKKENIYVIETNIDDLSGEYLGNEFQQKLFDQGALDFYLQQVIMKKGRPGIILTVLVHYSNLQSIGQFILEHTTVIGLRYFPVERMELPRQSLVVDTKFGQVKAKEVILPSGKRRMKVESDELFRLSKEKGLSPLEISNEIESVQKK